jgi:hypothetical protein
MFDLLESTLVNGPAQRTGKRRSSFPSNKLEQECESILQTTHSRFNLFVRIERFSDALKIPSVERETDLVSGIGADHNREGIIGDSANPTKRGNIDSAQAGMNTQESSVNPPIIQ